MVGRRDTGHRGQGDVRHGSHFKDMHKNPNEHVATCMGPNSPNWQRDPTPNETATQDSCRRGPCNASPSALTNAIPSQAACHSGATRYGPLPRLPAAHKTAHSHLLAAAPSRNAGTPISKSTIAKKAKSTGKKLIDLSKLVSPSTSASSSKDKTYKVQKAVFSLVRATYQKGDKKDQYSGAIYYRGKPRWGMNDKYKAKLIPNMLAESLRWNDELKLYSGKVWTANQAQLILDSMRQVSAEDENDLTDVTVDETIFDDAKEAAIKIFPITVAGELNLAIGGTTYPFKDILKKHGFGFHNIVNDQPLQLWLRVEPEAQPDMDADDLEALFDKYGFEVERYEGVEGSDDEDA